MTQKMLEKNVQALRKTDPDLAGKVAVVHTDDALQLLNTRSQSFTLKAEGFLLHSKYDPAREAKDWVDFHREKIDLHKTIVILGFGLGYHVTELLHRTNGRVVVFEPRLDVLRAAFEYLDFSLLLDRITFVTGTDVPRIKGNFTILEHKPSIKLNESYFAGVRKKLETLKRVNRGLKVMVVGPIHGGSLPVAKYCASALKNLGHKVDFADNSIYKEAFFSIKTITKNKEHQNYLMEMFSDFLSEALMARCGEFKPDLVFALAQAPISKTALIKLREYKIPTAFWFIEDFRLMTYWKEVAPFYDYFFTIQKDKFFDELQNAEVKNFHYLPLAASPDFHKKIQLSPEEEHTFGSDISFVGAGYYNRRKFFEGLIDFDFKIWGNEWDGGHSLKGLIQRNGERIKPEEIVKIFNASKINLNLHSSTYHNGINPHGDFVNPRTFEIAACEAFQLVDYRSELPSFFKIDREIVCFRDLKDLRDKIDYYLRNEEARREIARKARARVEKEHTYEHRMEEMVRFILERDIEFPEWNTKKEDLEVLIDKAKFNPQLCKYFAGYRGKKDELSLDEIVEDIRRGKEQLSRIEKIFLFVNAVKEQYTPLIEEQRR